MRNKLSFFIRCIGIVIIAYSGWELKGLFHYDRYLFLFQHLPKQTILFRYCYSIFLRLLLIVVGIGIVFRKDIFRKAIVLIACFAILTVYWKHPVIVFESVVNDMVKEGVLSKAFMERPELLTWILVVLNYCGTISSCLCLICFFSHHRVKKEFQ